jgi:hypothetical protein
MPLAQLLRGQSRPEIGIVFAHQVHDRTPKTRAMPPVARASALPGEQTCRSSGFESPAQAVYLAPADPHQFGRRAHRQAAIRQVDHHPQLESPSSYATPAVPTTDAPGDMSIGEESDISIGGLQPAVA